MKGHHPVGARHSITPIAVLFLKHRRPIKGAGRLDHVCRQRGGYKDTPVTLSHGRFTLLRGRIVDGRRCHGDRVPGDVNGS